MKKISAWTWIVRATLLGLAGVVPACGSGGGGGSGQNAGGDVPGSFSLVAPAEGGQNVSPSAAFSWEASAGAASYALEVATDSALTMFVIHETDLTGTSFTPATPLVPGTTYYWQVEAVNGSGTTVALGTPWSFTTESAAGAPGGFPLTSPPNGGDLIITMDSLSWAAANGAASYTIEVATDMGFSNVVLSASGIAGTTYSPASGPLQVGMTYYWRVYAVNSAGSTLATGAPWSFLAIRIVIDPPPPVGSTLVNQASGLALAVLNDATSSGSLVVQSTPTGSGGQLWTWTATGDGYYYLTNPNSGMDLSVPGASTTTGVQLIISPHTVGATNAEWAMTWNSAGTVTFINRNSGLAAEDEGSSTAPGNPIDQWTPDGTAAQEWSIVLTPALMSSPGGTAGGNPPGPSPEPSAATR